MKSPSLIPPPIAYRSRGRLELLNDIDNQPYQTPRAQPESNRGASLSKFNATRRELGRNLQFAARRSALHAGALRRDKTLMRELHLALGGLLAR